MYRNFPQGFNLTDKIDFFSSFFSQKKSCISEHSKRCLKPFERGGGRHFKREAIRINVSLVNIFFRIKSYGTNWQLWFWNTQRKKRRHKRDLLSFPVSPYWMSWLGSRKKKCLVLRLGWELQTSQGDTEVLALWFFKNLNIQ